MKTGLLHYIALDEIRKSKDPFISLFNVAVKFNKSNPFNDLLRISKAGEHIFGGGGEPKKPASLASVIGEKPQEQPKKPASLSRVIGKPVSISPKSGQQATPKIISGKKTLAGGPIVDPSGKPVTSHLGRETMLASPRKPPSPEKKIEIPGTPKEDPTRRIIVPGEVETKPSAKIEVPKTVEPTSGTGGRQKEIAGEGVSAVLSNRPERKQQMMAGAAILGSKQRERAAASPVQPISTSQGPDRPKPWTPSQMATRTPSASVPVMGESGGREPDATSRSPEPKSKHSLLFRPEGEVAPSQRSKRWGAINLLGAKEFGAAMAPGGAGSGGRMLGALQSRGTLAAQRLLNIRVPSHLRQEQYARETAMNTSQDQRPTRQQGQ